MKKRILKLVLGMIVVLCLTACQKNDSPPDSTQETSLVTNALIDSYYLGQDSEAYDYFHHSSIQRFLSMWAKNETGDIDQPIWHDDTFTKID